MHVRAKVIWKNSIKVSTVDDSFVVSGSLRHRAVKLLSSVAMNELWCDEAKSEASELLELFIRTSRLAAAATKDPRNSRLVFLPAMA
jgi:hypothetical protein